MCRLSEKEEKKMKKQKEDEKTKFLGRALQAVLYTNMNLSQQASLPGHAVKSVLALEAAKVCFDAVSSAATERRGGEQAVCLMVVCPNLALSLQPSRTASESLHGQNRMNDVLVCNHLQAFSAASNVVLELPIKNWLAKRSAEHLCSSSTWRMPIWTLSPN